MFFRKRCIIFLLVLMSIIMVGCDKPEEMSASSSDACGTSAENLWADIMDYSTQETIEIVVIGEKPADFSMVQAKINERLVELINTKVNIRIISLAEWPILYSSTLRGAEKVDICYTSDWSGYDQEANKGAFYELTEDFLSTYMPCSMESITPFMWQQTKIEGKMYGIPCGYTETSSYGSVLVRKDIMDELGIESINSYDEYEDFILKAAKLTDKNGYAMNAFPSLPMTSQFLFPKEHMLKLNKYLVWDTDLEFKAENIFFFYDTEEYKNYCLRMTKWADNGVWPSNAITSIEHTSDSFRNGNSFSVMVRGHEAQKIINTTEENGFEVYYNCILDEEAYIIQATTSGDMMAITAFSENPERAAVVLDILKNDAEVNHLCVGGIEGVHYILNEDGSRSVGPESEKYGWDAWSWGIRNSELYLEEKKSDEVKKIDKMLEEHLYPVEDFLVADFRPDNSSIQLKLEMIDSIINEYQYSFDLGVFGSEVEAKYEEFIQKLYDAGLKDVVEEWRRQISITLENAS